MARLLCAIELAALLVATTTVASADTQKVPVSERSVHGGIGAGVYGAITGSERAGSFIDAVFYPGGFLDRFGVRLEARGLGQVAPNAFLAGVTYEAGAARPTLALGLYAVGGATLDSQPAAAAGVQAQLAYFGPLGIGADLSGLLIVDGTQGTELLLTGALTVRLSR